eukprot:UN30285
MQVCEFVALDVPAPDGHPHPASENFCLLAGETDSGNLWSGASTVKYADGFRDCEDSSEPWYDGDVCEGDGPYDDEDNCNQFTTGIFSESGAITSTESGMTFMGSYSDTTDVPDIFVYECTEVDLGDEYVYANLGYFAENDADADAATEIVNGEGYDHVVTAAIRSDP